MVLNQRFRNSKICLRRLHGIILTNADTKASSFHKYQQLLNEMNSCICINAFKKKLYVFRRVHFKLILTSITSLIKKAISKGRYIFYNQTKELLIKCLFNHGIFVLVLCHTIYECVNHTSHKLSTIYNTRTTEL